MLENYVWIVPLLPMLAALWIALGYGLGWNRGEAGERQTARVAVYACTFSLLFLIGLDIQVLIYGPLAQVVVAPWLVSGELQLDISFTLDSLGLSMATLVAFIAMLTLRFSVNYLHREAAFQRFFMVMSLFVSAMLLIVMAGSAVLVFVGWELAGVSSYLLIVYHLDRPVAATNATRAFITNRMGDAGFILAIFLSFLWMGDVEWPAILAGSEGLETLSADMLAGAFVLAALAKSAQFPFSPWIARALEGPTPSSAIFYGSLMVHAGVYLVIRLEPLMLEAPAILGLLAMVGLFTAVYGWMSGLVQTDVKSSLMFATTAQVGLMFLWCGLGWFTLAAWHLGLHASWRAYQFLHAPSLMHLVSRSARPAPAWLRKSRLLHTVSMQRFWLEPLGDLLLVKSTASLAQDVRNFDDLFVRRIVGLPAQISATTAGGNVGQGRGLIGGLMERIASTLCWFEENLILSGGGDRMITLLAQVGEYMRRVELLLSQPRYLLLLVMATFVVIL